MKDVEMDYAQALEYPYDLKKIFRKKKAIKRVLLPTATKAIKIAFLGGSTTAEILDILELFLLKNQIRAEFYESDYNRYYEDAVYGNDKLDEFKPDIVYVHTTGENIQAFPCIDQTNAEVDGLIGEELSKFKAVWRGLHRRFSCQIIQNNFEYNHLRALGALDTVDYRGKNCYILKLNQEFARLAELDDALYINDIHYLSSILGLDEWADRSLWWSSKYALSFNSIPTLAHNISSIICGIYGRTKKCLTLDLDNTLWGGVVGDDGPEGIRLGEGDAVAEAYASFQRYIKLLHSRGVILSVCSKNDEGRAKEGFGSEGSVLGLNDFAAFYANWSPKNQNIENIAKDLNIGGDSIVFVDDNPVERALVSKELPQVAIPELGSDVVDYPALIDRNNYFHTLNITTDDIQRNESYRDNAKRHQEVEHHQNYDDFLKSLGMSAIINSFDHANEVRIAQLINKTNQFNLTGLRVATPQVDEAINNPRYITLYAKLKDKFGDNGLVSVVMGEIQGQTLQIIVWVMSCRVFKRTLESCVMNVLVQKCLEHDIRIIKGRYLATAKNEIVSEHYGDMGFAKLEGDVGSSAWELDVATYRDLDTMINI